MEPDPIKRENYDDLSLLDAIKECIPVLETVAEQSELLARLSESDRIALIKAAGKISRPDKKEIKKRNKDKRRLKRLAIVEKQRRLRASTGIRKAREDVVFSAPRQIAYDGIEDNAPTLETPRDCYVCKAKFTKLHHFYDTMCPECARLNYEKRFQTTSLKGQVALITGSRLKIGYQATVMMLKAGATVIATTRFPKDSALRFAKEDDFSDWGHRLHVYGLDLRHTPSVELFCDYVKETYHRLDILINNAAQTVRRPPGFYAHLMENETRHTDQLPEYAQALLGQYQTCLSQLTGDGQGNIGKEKALPVTWDGKAPGVGLRMSAQLSQIPYSYDHTLNVPEVFPAGKLDADLQQTDLRKTNSWRLRLGEIQTSEMLEIQLVNAVAPFVLCNRLAELMKLDYTGQKHIVNVSAMEGKFLRFKKGSRHPHTNMAKASLNMLTHTAASNLAKYGIYMNAVDTGWVTDEDPATLAKKKQDIHDFQPPLDIVDGAARICDPFFHGILTGKHWCGKFLKDYFPIDW